MVSPAQKALSAWNDRHMEFAETRRVLRESDPSFPAEFTHQWEESETISTVEMVPYWFFWSRETLRVEKRIFTLSLEKKEWGWIGRMDEGGRRVLYFHYLNYSDQLKVEPHYYQGMLKAQPFLVKFFGQPKKKGPPDEPESPSEPEGLRP